MSSDCYDDDDEQYELVEDQMELQELLEDQEKMNELEIPDVRWKDDIKNIPDLDLKLQEIEKASVLLDEEKALKARLDSGEISPGKHDVIYQDIIKPKMRKATTRCGLASVGLTYDHLGDISEDAEFSATGSLKMPELKDRLKKTIEDIGPDAAEELADRMLADERLGKDAHERIKRQVRLNRKNRGE